MTHRQMPARTVQTDDPPRIDASPVTVRGGLLETLVAARRVESPGSRATDPTIACTTARMILRPLRESDKDEFLRVYTLSRPHLAAWCPLSTDEHDQQPAGEVFARQVELARRAVETGRAWRVCGFDERDRLVGAFNINDIARGLENIGELVFWVGVEHAGKGYASEGVRAAIQHAIADLPRGLRLHRLTALVAPENTACRLLMARVGMRLEPLPPIGLRLSGRSVLHDTYSMYAPVTGVVEGKPSIAENIFGRGLLSILKTESHDPDEMGHSRA